MQLEWYGQSAFRLSSPEVAVAIDPFADFGKLSGGAVQFEYPPIEDVPAELLLITHEHRDHNYVDGIAGDPVVLRSTAGRLESSIGEIVAIASEHDDLAGTERGPNTIFVFTLDGVRACHFGDFGQRELREEQAEAIGEVDLLILPVGGGPTIGAAQALAIVRRLHPRWVVPMHYRTPRVGFLETADEFLAPFEHVELAPTPIVDTNSLPTKDGPVAVVPATP